MTAAGSTYLRKKWTSFASPSTFDMQQPWFFSINEPNDTFFKIVFKRAPESVKKNDEIHLISIITTQKQWVGCLVVSYSTNPLTGDQDKRFDQDDIA